MLLLVTMGPVGERLVFGSSTRHARDSHLCFGKFPFVVTTVPLAESSLLHEQSITVQR